MAHELGQSRSANSHAMMRRSVVFGLPSLLGACAAGQSSSLHEGAFSQRDFPTAPMSPAFGDGPIQTLANSSCSDESKPTPLYNDIRLAKPDALLMIGDNVYGSMTPDDPQLSDLRAAYWQMARRPEFKALVSEVPTLSVWDDHDFGKNDAGGDFTHKALAQRMFNDFWNVPVDSPLRSRPGLYRSQTIGPVGQRTQIIMLDTRYFRDPLRLTDQRGVAGRERYIPHPIESSADILGAAQWAWLAATLKEPADIRIIASSIQVIADGHGYERWGQFPAAQERLYRVIETTGAKGVVFVSGDRHLGAINTLPRRNSYPLHDLTGSAINTSSWQEGRATSNSEASAFAIGPTYTPPNYGRIRIDWQAKQVALEVVGAGNQTANRTQFGFDKLGLG